MSDTTSDFDRFLLSSADGLMRTAYLIIGELSEAEDVVQEALVKVAARWPRVRRMDHPLAYTRRILINLASERAARRARDRDQLASEPASEPAERDDPTDALTVRDALIGALATLPQQQRSVLVLRYFLDLSEADVAAALRCPLGTVKSSTARGLARLEQALNATDNQWSIRT